MLMMMGASYYCQRKDKKIRQKKKFTFVKIGKYVQYLKIFFICSLGPKTNYTIMCKQTLRATAQNRKMRWSYVRTVA